MKEYKEEAERLALNYSAKYIKMKPINNDLLALEKGFIEGYLKAQSKIKELENKLEDLQQDYDLKDYGVDRRLGDVQKIEQLESQLNEAVELLEVAFNEDSIDANRYFRLMELLKTK